MRRPNYGAQYCTGESAPQEKSRDAQSETPRRGHGGDAAPRYRPFILALRVAFIYSKRRRSTMATVYDPCDPDHLDARQQERNFRN